MDQINVSHMMKHQSEILSDNSDLNNPRKEQKSMCDRKRKREVKPGRKKKKMRKKQLRVTETLMVCARESSEKGLARIYESSDDNDEASDLFACTCFTQSGKFPSRSPLSSNLKAIIVVKPLVVLDLNGILCRRVRFVSKNNTSPSSYLSRNERGYLRPFIGHVAGTPVIARSNLSSFLTLLDDNFALGVWSSAKQKTVRNLINILFPSDISKRLLFSWGQDRCQAKHLANDECIFKKPLSKIWDLYPLWNSSNTLLIDDSPDKCVDFSNNTINPPSITGYKQDTDNGLLDAINEDKQELFFTELAKSFCCPLDMQSNKLMNFLKKNAPESWKVV